MLSDFAKEKVFWTKKMNLKLVKFMQSKPNIWNPKHPKYTSVEYRDRTYAEFASKYGDEFTGQAVKDRWTNIRSTFANYLRKVNASRAIPDGEEYKVNWHLWGPCQFLLKVSKKGKNNLLQHDICSEEEQESLEKSKEWNSEDNQEHLIGSSNNMCKDIADNLVKILDGVQNESFCLEKSKYGNLAVSVSNQLSQMNSYDAAKVSQKIMEILLLYDEQNPQNPNNLHVQPDG